MLHARDVTLVTLQMLFLLCQSEATLLGRGKATIINLLGILQEPKYVYNLTTNTTETFDNTTISLNEITLSTSPMDSFDNTTGVFSTTTNTEWSTDNATIEGSGETTTDTADNSTEYNTTTFEVTTGAEVVVPFGSSVILVPLWLALLLLIIGIIVGGLLVWCVQTLPKWLKSRKSVSPTPPPSRVASTILTVEPSPSPGILWEDAILKAMASGQIGVLQFALTESSRAGLMRQNPELVGDAETKLKSWKQIHSQLEKAYLDKDLSSVDELMNEFNKCKLKEESGTYQLCVELKRNIKDAEISMANAKDARDEIMLMAAMRQYENLKLPESTMETNKLYQEANKEMKELSEEKTANKSQEKITADLRAAVLAQEPVALAAALDVFVSAKIPDTYNEVENAKRTLNKLKKREKRRAKEERRKERENASRMAEIEQLTEMLQQAIASKNSERLQLALEEFEESGYNVKDVPAASQAEAFYASMNIQNMRERLRHSIKRRDVSGLEKAIDDADYGGYVMDVKKEYDIAKELLYHLRELNRLRKAVLEMNRSLISEIHKYPTPPPIVHQVMTAVFILLGESPIQMKYWFEVQTLLGKMGQDSIARRVTQCVPGDIPIKVVKRAEEQLQGLNLDELTEISKGAATFFAWAKCIIKERVENDVDRWNLADLEPVTDIHGVSN